MKLYYMPGACSLSPHIALIEAGAPFEAVKVGRDKRTADGQDFLDINPYGYVPALVLDDGTVLTEGPAITQFVADRFPESEQAPPNGSIERYKLQAALGFINSELHKTASGLFDPEISEEQRERTARRLEKRLGQLAAQMDGKEWIANDRYSVADAYLFVVERWLASFKIDIAQWPVLAAHHARMRARPSVQKAMEVEKLR
jgi:glutathione S-transferase